jgi:HTH-type transcriptional regulator / antitoxin HigA
MANTHSKRAVSDSYLKLIRQFPLRHIATEEQLDDATEVLRDLLQRDLDEGGVQYRDALTDLIELYEDTAHPIPDASQAAVLEMLMESNRITGTELAKKTSISHSTISAVLHGDRKLTTDHIRKLAKQFNVSVAAFFPRE